MKAPYMKKEYNQPGSACQSIRASGQSIRSDGNPLAYASVRTVLGETLKPR
jgi:hypothetical protein